MSPGRHRGRPPVPSLLNCVSEGTSEYRSRGTWQHRGVPEKRHKRDWGVGQPGPASYQLCDERQTPRCSSPPAPEWPFWGTDRIRSPPCVREKPGRDHLAQSLVTVNARDIGARKGTSEERHSQTRDSHLDDREDSSWGKSIYRPRHGGPPLALLLPLSPVPSKDTNCLLARAT